MTLFEFQPNEMMQIASKHIKRSDLFVSDELRHAVCITQQDKLVQPLELDPSAKFHFSAGIRLSQLAACMAPHGERVQCTISPYTNRSAIKEIPLKIGNKIACLPLLESLAGKRGRNVLIRNVISNFMFGVSFP